MLPIPGWLPAERLAVALAVVIAALVVRRLDRPQGRWGAALRRRLVLGVPWGTLTTALGVLCVYLFVQGGMDRWYSPLTIPFRAWSYFYPVGMLTASFTHVGAGHLTGNLIGTLVFAPLAEFGFGHFPRERGASSFGSLRTNPYVRAFVIVPGAAAVVGVLSSVFGIGPVIGFSSVVFAFAGAALVNYPFATVIAVSAGRVLRLLYDVMRMPRLTAQAEPVYSTPWWAGIAIQGHAFGLLVGVALGAWVVRTRGGDRPSALRLGTGALVFAVVESLWAVYWYRGNESYVLFRAAGLALVVLLATVVVLAVASSDRPLVPTGASFRRYLPSLPEEIETAPRWKAAVAVLLIATAALSGPAVAYNLAVVGDDDLPGESVSIRGYQVTYAEDVPNGMTAAFEIEAFGETTTVNTSGVIVRNPRRSIWTTAVSKGRLAFSGRSVVSVGGVGWRENVLATRSGWTAAGGNATYRVTLRHDGIDTVAYVAPPARARPIIAGRNVSVATTPGEFLLVVGRNNETVAAPVPAKNETVVLDDVRFVRRGPNVVATYEGTRVRVASRERYPGQQ